MITYTSGNILEADVDAVVNTVNTVGVMGKGLALQFKRRYPANYEAYRQACQSGVVELGRMFVTQPPEISGPKWIINFPTKGHWKANSRLADIRSGLQDLVKVIREHGIRSIAIPPLGAGNGGLNWRDVRPLIAAALEQLPDVRVEVYEPTTAHFAVKGAPTRLTRTKALLMELMLAYSRQRQAVEPWEDARGASHLEAQKLMYFASKAIPTLSLKFTKAQYGPYSDVVRILLRELEGSFLEGFGDGSDPVLELAQIEITDSGMAALEGFHDPEIDSEAIGRAVNDVLGYVSGFEGAYPMELLSSVKWAVDETGSAELSTVTEYIRGWNYRKGQLFTPHHIESALARVSG